MIFLWNLVSFLLLLLQTAHALPFQMNVAYKQQECLYEIVAAPEDAGM